MPIPTDQERIGTTIDGKYRILSLLGKGGMATVFRARHTWTERPVALKILQPQYATDEVIVRRFLREARAAASFRHPNVVEVLDMGPLPEGGAYMALALLDGESLGAMIARGGTLSLEATYAALLPVMRALAGGHERGIVHRDIKPENLFLARNDMGAIVPTLLDFGIAKVAEESGKVTTTGLVFGTPQYMAPEQARAVADLDGRADQWSLAAVWFECLTGAPPFDAPTPTAVLARILSERASPLRSVRPELPESVCAVIDRALSPNRDERFATLDAFSDALVAAAVSEGISTDFSSGSRAVTRERTASHRAVESAKTLAAVDLPTQVPASTTRRERPSHAALFAAVSIAVVASAALVLRPQSPRATAVRTDVVSQDAMTTTPAAPNSDASSASIALPVDVVIDTADAHATTSDDARSGASAPQRPTRARDAGRSPAASAEHGSNPPANSQTPSSTTATPHTIGVTTNY
jgi:serine/threonine-protein kinase